MSNINNELLAQIEALKAENANLKSKATNTKAKGKSMRVSAKGAVSVYGMGRFPVTLYATQWEQLFNMVEDIKGFIKDNESLLAKREEEVKVA
jgi:hypothetical protein